MYLAFSAVLDEKLELSDFPFDGQFLNLKFTYNINHYRLGHKCPDWLLANGLRSCGRYYLTRPLQIAVKDSIQSQWRVLSPWMDLRLRGNVGKFGHGGDEAVVERKTSIENLTKNYTIYDPNAIQDEADFQFRFSLIRLRVIRQPGFYLYNGVLPLTLVVLCAFAAFAVDSDTNLGEKLSFVVTLLLTVSAFQYSLTVDLPQTSETTMIDTYILTAYCVLTIIVAEIAIVAAVVDDPSLALQIDLVVAIICALIWTWFTGRFVVRYVKYRTGAHINWNAMSVREMRNWHRGENDSKFKVIEPGNLFVD
jgi:hypothetical protein